MRKAVYPSGFIEPSPTKAVRPPSGPDWVHEIKHDGFRLLVRKERARVRCFTRGGHDWADRFPAIVEAAKRLRPIGVKNAHQIPADKNWGFRFPFFQRN